MLRRYTFVIATLFILLASCVYKQVPAEGAAEELAGTSWEPGNDESTVESLIFVDSTRFLKMVKENNDLTPTIGTWKYTTGSVVELKTETATEQVQIKTDELVLNGEVYRKK